MKLLALSLLLLSAASATAWGAKPVTVASPDGLLKATFSQPTAGDSLSFQLSYKGESLIAPSPIAWNIRNAKPTKMGKPKFTNGVAEHIVAPFYRQEAFDITYNQAIIPLGNQVSMWVRAFNDGVAYRYICGEDKPVTIDDETADFRFPHDLRTIMAFQPDGDVRFRTAFQNTYLYDSLSVAKTDQLAFLPVVADYGNGLKLTIAESDLRSYPGMFIHPHPETLSLEAVFAPYPAKIELNSWRKQEYVTKGEDFIAKTNTTPWRIFALSTNDRQMPVNNLVYALAQPQAFSDISWIAPGTAQWDWWHDWTERGVDFRAGINTPTYKHYIDFAAEQGIPYIVIDEGWYDPKSGDMLTVVSDLNLEELVAYGQKKNVGIVLWTVFHVLDSQLQEACKKYSEMGIKGFKVDFMDRNDQLAVEQAERIAGACADSRLMLDYHGIYPPAGLNRTFPNIVNFEAVFGMEEAKWTDIDKHDMPLYDVTFPYIRMMAGPIDFTPGAMANANRGDWRAIYSEPISQGTRCHQAASYVVVDSPFTMFADKPSAYRVEPDYTAFVAAIPTTFKQTAILDGQLGEYIVSLREGNDGKWYIGGQTNWTPRDLSLPLNFLPEGAYNIELLADGANADRNAMDWKITSSTATAADKLNVHMAPGGGFVAVISPVTK